MDYADGTCDNIHYNKLIHLGHSSNHLPEHNVDADVYLLVLLFYQTALPDRTNPLKFHQQSQFFFLHISLIKASCKNRNFPNLT